MTEYDLIVNLQRDRDRLARELMLIRASLTKLAVFDGMPRDQVEGEVTSMTAEVVSQLCNDNDKAQQAIDAALLFIRSGKNAEGVLPEFLAEVERILMTDQRAPDNLSGLTDPES